MNRLRQVRKQKGLTLEELAKELQEKENLKIVPNGLGKYQREEREPKKETWLKLANYYDVPVAYLMGLPDGLVQHINKSQAMTTDDTKSNRLRELRKQQGLTLKQVAEDTGILADLIGKYERGERKPKIETLVKLSDYYSVPIEYFAKIPIGLTRYEQGQNDMLALIKNIYYTSSRKEFEDFLGAGDLDDNEVMRFLQERYMRLGKKQLIKSIVKEFNL